MNKEKLKICLLLIGCIGLAVMAAGSAFNAFKFHWTNVTLIYSFVLMAAFGANS